MIIDKFTKIIATIGPTCESETILKKLIQEGVNVFRLNFSHGDHAQHKAMIKKIRNVSAELNIEICILMDLQGPKIRIGTVQDPNGMELKKGDKLTITTRPCEGKDYKVSTVYQYFIQDVNVGDTILIDDGLLKLKAIEKRTDEIDFEVFNPIRLKSKKGINLPHIPLSTPALSEKDVEDLKFGIENDVDVVALSFVRSVKDLDLIYGYMEKFGKRLPVISKIEKPEAMDEIDQIIAKSFGIMIARGDLGIETPAEKLPILQKNIARKCNLSSKPVIIATQMLDSMIRNPTATRAEITDIANAILDGADVLMLSGETAMGNYPVEAVRTMSSVIKSTEEEFFKSNNFKKHITDNFDKKTLDDNICYTAVSIAKNLGAKTIACVTHTGGTVRKLAKYRAYRPLVAVTHSVPTIRLMNLSWGAYSLMIEDFSKLNVQFSYLQEMLIETKHFKDGDYIVITAGVPAFKHNTTNCIKVYEVNTNKNK